MEQHDPSEGLSVGPILLATALIFILMACVWVGPLITDSLAVQTEIVVAIVITLVIATVVVGKQGTTRGKVLAIFAAWIAMTLAFGVLYALIYAHSPASFRASRDLYDQSARSELDALEPDLRETLRELYCVELLDGSAARLDVLGFFSRTPRVARLTPDITFSVSTIIYQRPESDYTRSFPAARVTVEWTERGKPLVLFIHTYSAVEVDPRNRFVEAMGDTRKGADVRAAIAPFHAFLQQHIAKLDRRAAALLTGGIALDISHFVFMSGSISTTVGSADVTPNSPGTRLLVVIQAFCSVFLFGYAAQVLWSS